MSDHKTNSNGYAKKETTLPTNLNRKPKLKSKLYSLTWWFSTLLAIFTFLQIARAVRERKRPQVQFPDLYEASILELQQGLDAGHFSSVDLVKTYFARIDEVNVKGPALRAIIELNPSALAQAASLDKERKSSAIRAHAPQRTSEVKHTTIRNGHRYFVSCSNWSNRFSEGHRTSFIPSGVKDEHLEVLFSGGNLPGFEEPFPCGRIVPAHIGSRVSHCNFPHLGNGSQAALVHQPCSAYRVIYVPENTTIRKACIVPDHDKPHNHPILPPTKTPVAIKEVYRKCIKNAGLVGSSVRTIDNARSTKLTLGTSPSLYAPTLQNNRVKQDIIREEKKKSYPCGTDLPGVIYLMNKDLSKPIEERYIHGFATTIHGGRVLLTANPFLLGRIHQAKTLFVDTTFKRTVGALKEWEVVMYDKEVERAVTIARVYSDRADRLQYKTIFDELQRVTLVLTERPLRLKRLSRNGTLISVGVDMELAQALGAGDSFLPTNEPEYSNIHVQTAEEIIEFFIRACYTHAKRGIHDLKSYVTDEEYERLINFMYLETKEEVDEFSKWVKSLINPKVQAWWDHKTNNSWILPSLIKCLSKMNSDDWDLTPPTTNVGESQHHWTNINTGIQLSLLEAILTAREVDEKVAAEIKAALETGVLKNHRNDTFTRLARNTARTTHAYKKSQETRQKKKALNVVDEELTSLKDSQKENAARIKELKATKSNIAGKGKSSGAESSSSGKVAVTGVSKRKRAKVALRLATVKKGVDQTRATLVSEPVESAETSLPTLNMPMDIADGTYLNPSSEAIEFGNVMPRTVYEEANYAGPSSESSNVAAPVGPYYSYPLAAPSYALPPFADMTATANLFPQTLPGSVEFESPPLYDIIDTTPGPSGLEFFAMADHAETNNNTSSLDTMTGNIDFHSSDHIFDSFNITFGFTDSAY